MTAGSASGKQCHSEVSRSIHSGIHLGITGGSAADFSAPDFVFRSLNGKILNIKIIILELIYRTDVKYYNEKTLYALLLLLPALSARGGQASYVDYVSPLVGTMSKFELSTGNTYPAIARPWGMNFWTPQTGEMGNGWTYTYTADKIRGFKQTHQPSPWMNDYGQFSIMPVSGTRHSTRTKGQAGFPTRRKPSLHTITAYISLTMTSLWN